MSADRPDRIRDGPGRPAAADGGQIRHPHRPLVIDLKRDQVALIDTDDRRIDSHCHLELGLVVDFDEHVETDARGELMERQQLVAVQGGSNQ